MFSFNTGPWFAHGFSPPVVKGIGMGQMGVWVVGVNHNFLPENFKTKNWKNGKTVYQITNRAVSKIPCHF